MPQSLSNLLVHVVFSTKNREPWLVPALRPRVHGYLAETVRNMGGLYPHVGGVADHVHLGLNLSRAGSVSELVEAIKCSSSRWIKTQGKGLAGFAWQRGYAAFSVGQEGWDSLGTYITNQEEHHRTRTFADEYRELLRHHRVAFDERYVWD